MEIYASAENSTLLVEVSDSIGCEATASFVISQFPWVKPEVTGNLRHCPEDSCRLTVGAGFVSYSWNTGTVGETCYARESDNPVVLFATDSNDCIISDTFKLEQVLVIHPVISGKLQHCPGDSVCLSVQDLFAQVSWSTGETTDSIYASANKPSLKVEVTDSNGCKTDTTINLSPFSLPVASVSSDFSYCANDSVLLKITEVFAEYRWGTGSDSSSTYADGSQNPVTVELVDANGCKQTQYYQLSELPLPLLKIVEDQDFCTYESVRPKILSQYASSFLWSNGSVKPDPEYHIVNAKPGNYSIWLKAENKCGSVIDSGSVSLSYCACNFYIPNALTPNGDGINDELRVVYDCIDYESFDLRIFDRWGHVVFKAISPDQVWDGFVKDRKAGQDLYAWQLSFTSIKDPSNPEVITDSGKIFILR